MAAKQLGQRFLVEKIMMVQIENWETLTQRLAEQAINVVDDCHDDAARTQVHKRPAQHHTRIEEMVEHVDQGDQVEMVGREIRILEELRGDMRARNFLGDLARQRHRLDTPYVGKAVSPSGLEQKAHVAADIEPSLPPWKIRPTQISIA